MTCEVFSVGMNREVLVQQVRNDALVGLDSSIAAMTSTLAEGKTSGAHTAREIFNAFRTTAGRGFVSLLRELRVIPASC